MTREPTLLADACEGGRNRIMIWLRPNSQVKIVWIAVDDAGRSLWHEACYPHAVMPTLHRIADAGENGGQTERPPRHWPCVSAPDRSDCLSRCAPGSRLIARRADRHCAPLHLGERAQAVAAHANLPDGLDELLKGAS